MKKFLITLLFFPLIGGDLSESHKRSFDEMAGEVDISDILDHVGPRDPLDESIFNIDSDVPFKKLLEIGDKDTAGPAYVNDAEDTIFDPLNRDYWANSINQQPLDLGVTYTAAKKHKKLPCPECDCSVNNLKEHMRTHTGEKPYKCEYPGCDHQFRTKCNLYEHMKIHTNERQFECIICNRRFIRSQTLNDHIKRHLGEKPFKCNWQNCNFASVSSCSLNIHMKTHTVEKPFKCEHPECGYAAIVKQNLIYHMGAKHRGEKPYKCEHPGCSYASAKLSNVKSHAIIHTEEKPYKCEHPGCSYATFYYHHLKNHIKIHNKILCVICNKMVGDLSAHSKTKEHKRNVADEE